MTKVSFLIINLSLNGLDNSNNSYKSIIQLDVNRSKINKMFDYEKDEDSKEIK